MLLRGRLSSVTLPLWDAVMELLVEATEMGTGAEISRSMNLDQSLNMCEVDPVSAIILVLT